MVYSEKCSSEVAGVAKGNTKDLSSVVRVKFCGEALERQKVFGTSSCLTYFFSHSQTLIERLPNNVYIELKIQYKHLLYLESYRRKAIEYL